MKGNGIRIGVAASIAVLLTGVLLHSRRGPERSPATSAAIKPAPPAVPGASAGSPPASGSERSAASAAAGYLAELSRLTLSDPSGREAALRAMVASDGRKVVPETLAAMRSMDGVVAQARAVVPDARVLLREVPVAFSVRSSRPERAEVRIWGMSLLLIEGRTQATEVWSTNTFHLSWEGARWRVSGWQRSPGPVPASGLQPPTDPGAVLDAVDGWEGFGYAPAS